MSTAQMAASGRLVADAGGIQVADAGLGTSASTPMLVQHASSLVRTSPMSGYVANGKRLVGEHGLRPSSGSAEFLLPMGAIAPSS